MLREKICDVLSELNNNIAEREELLTCIAIALLTRKNLFILGETGQAKSYAIDEFRKRITGAVQFERLLSKQTDEEQLFGRLDLASLIPGKISTEDMNNNSALALVHDNIRLALEAYEKEQSKQNLTVLEHCKNEAEILTQAVSVMTGSKPKVITTGKIPEAHIVFLDEAYKANDGILNSLLRALNERVYTNEGETYSIPTISFFAASNEIPDFKNPEESILRPLHDRFDLKIKTDYIQERSKRQQILSQKQLNSNCNMSQTSFSLQELCEMQKEVASIIIPERINELMDDILLELRSRGVAVSDRKFFGYGPVVQATAWLRGNTEASEQDLLYLKNYLWTNPEEIPLIEQVLQTYCENRIGQKIDALRSLALEALDAFETDNSNNSNRALIKFRSEILSVYKETNACLSENITEKEKQQLSAFISELGEINRKAHEKTSFTYLTLSELDALEK